MPEAEGDNVAVLRGAPGEEPGAFTQQLREVTRDEVPLGARGRRSEVHQPSLSYNSQGMPCSQRCHYLMVDGRKARRWSK